MTLYIDWAPGIKKPTDQHYWYHVDWVTKHLDGIMFKCGDRLHFVMDVAMNGWRAA